MVETHEISRGTNTISMKTARSVFLWHSRSWTRKVAEGYYTILIGILWSKERILENNLKVVDRGGSGVVRTEAAILPSLHVWSPAAPTGYAKEKQLKSIKDMKRVTLEF